MMQLTRDILHKHKDSHEDFGYYYKLIKKAENNVSENPDISIESSKSLVEGISKTILKNLNATYTEAKARKTTFPQLFSTACKCVNEYVELEIDFIHRTQAMIVRLGQLRTDRGDISHGKSVPKLGVSSESAARMIMRVIDSISAYLLESFFSIDLSYQREVAYEKNQGFNETLDENYPLEGLEGIVYSKALHDQDYDAYEEQLRDYLDSLDQEELE